MIFRWSNRAETIRPVAIETRLCLALAGSLALHLAILGLFAGAGNIGSNSPFADGESMLPGNRVVVKRSLTARLSSVAHHSPQVDTAAKLNQPQPTIVIRDPDTEAHDSVAPQPTDSPTHRASPPEPPAPATPVLRETAPAGQELPPPTVPSSAALQENSPDASQDAAETAARRAGYLAGTRLDNKPGLLSEIIIEYPESAGGQSGRVVLQLFIDEHGYVRETVINQAIPPGFFEQAAITAFSRARFSPGMLSGRAVKSQLRIEVDFSVFNRPTATSGKPAY